MKLRLFILLAITISSANFAFAQSSGKDERAFKSLIKQMTDAQLGFDAVALDKIFAADYIEISPLGAVDQRKEVLSFYTPEAKANTGKMSVTVEVDDYSIRSYEKFGIAVARFNYTITSDGKPQPPRSIRVMLVFRKEKDLWKIASAQYTGIRVPQPQKPN